MARILIAFQYFIAANRKKDGSVFCNIGNALKSGVALTDTSNEVEFHAKFYRWHQILFLRFISNAEENVDFNHFRYMTRVSSKIKLVLEGSENFVMRNPFN